MTPERWQSIERLYHAALERETDEQSAFLAEACAGDEALRGEVESLLRCDARGGIDQINGGTADAGRDRCALLQSYAPSR